MKKLLLVLLPGLVLFSCSKNTDQTPQETPSAINNPVYQYIKKLGFHDSEIKDIGKEYLVDEDILFPKNGQPDFSIFNDGPKTEQYGTSNYVGYNVQPNITVRIDPSMNAYTSEIQGAIAIWNNVINCRVKFTLTTATNQNILITNSNLGAGFCGAAYFPVNGQPGALVRININEIAGNSFLQRQRTIAHELGHTIGFRHTNWQGYEDMNIISPDNSARITATHLLGTPTGTDANSLMNGRECGIGATSLSNFDILAVQYLYPANPPVAGTVPVFRYCRVPSPTDNMMDHFYTTDLSELGNGNNNDYIFEGVGFFAFTNQASGTVPVYRYYNVSNIDHFYTTVSNNYGGYVYERIAFYAYPSSGNGAQPIKRFNSTKYTDHFYTKNPNENPNDYTFEGNEFYAY